MPLIAGVKAGQTRSLKGLAALVLAEFVIVAGGVLFALIVDEWRSDRAQAALVEASLRAIGEELAANRALIEERYDYHRTAYPKAFAELNRMAEGARGDLSWFKGLQVPRLQDAAYRSAIEAGLLTLIPPERSTLIAQAYRDQANIAEIGRVYLGVIAGITRDEGERYFNAIGYALSQLAIEEEIVLESIKKAQRAVEG